MKKNAGMSLIELIVVIGVFSIISVIVGQSVVTTFRGAKRSDSDSLIRENIDYAGAIIERHLRNSLTLTCTSATRIDFTDQNKNAGAFLLAGSGADRFIASFSALPSNQTVRITSNTVTVEELNFVCATPVGNVAPQVDIVITASDRNAQGTDRAMITTSLKVVKRTNY